ncbi:MAG: polyketide cyclase [Humibacillus sp.]|nr:polyketide cyclase [Humibacillus sp.]
MIGDRWGVRDAEVEAAYGCDGLVTNPGLRAWRGVTVHTSADALWPWVCQIRAAPYSYDWVDNLGRRSPQVLLGLPEPVVGESFTRTAGHPIGTVLAVTPGRELTGRILGAVMTYRLDPGSEAGAASTRLVLKIVMKGHPVVAGAVSVGDLVMARRQLLTFKRLAEQHG